MLLIETISMSNIKIVSNFRNCNEALSKLIEAENAVNSEKEWLVFAELKKIFND